MLAPVVLKEVSKRYGEQPLFEGISFSIQSKERLGIIGPNGSGKSTLLKLIAGSETPDSGEVIRSRGLKLSYVEQVASFPSEQTPLALAQQVASENSFSPAEGETLARTSLGRLKIDFEETPFAALSGGQQKRAQIALALCTNPDLVLLDEPTNHLDIEAILSIESLLSNSSFAWVMVSHDRWFLENTVSRIIELNRRFEGGLTASDGGYSNYLQHRAKVLASQEKQLDSLKNKVRQEEAWLRQGAKARSTKSKERTSRAYALMDSLSMIRSRNNTQKAKVDFQFSERKTKRLLELVNVSKSYGDKVVFDKLNLRVIAGEALGILGRNGSGKTTLIKLLVGELEPDKGVIKRAAELSVSHFKQIDNSISGETPLKEVLAEEGDSVIFRGREVHVATWGKRFGFSYDQLHQPYESLSGGEKAKVRIAKLMLQTPDVLILDEPTNDLDIDTLEMLEESLLEFQGALVLVTHDRFMIHRLCNGFCGLDGKGQGTSFADYEQWEKAFLKRKKAAKSTDSKNATPKKKASGRLGYLEQREYDGMEAAIEAAEQELAGWNEALKLPEAQTNAEKLQELCEKLKVAQRNLDALYARWEELEHKKQG